MSARDTKAADRVSTAVRQTVTGVRVMTSPWADPDTTAAMRRALGLGALPAGTVMLTSPDGDPYFVLDHSALDGDDLLE